jgi:sugar (pentulose or hexulose) kinase
MLLAGIDIGTTGARCMIFDSAGRRVSQAYEEYPLIVLGGGLVEQSVSLLLETTARVCSAATSAAEVDATDIVSIGLSNQCAATCAVTSSGELIRPLISWQDTRAIEQVQQIADSCPPEQFKQITGGPIAPQLTLPTILWLREHEPETFERADKWVQIQDIALRFLGVDGFYVDIPQTAFYGMWDVPNGQWSDELMDIAGLNPASFGSPVPAGTQVGEISDAAAQRTGFAEGTPVCVGAGDLLCGMVGMGAISPGIAALTVGTSGSVQISMSEPRVDIDEFFTVNHPRPGQWTMIAITLAAASAYRWFRDVFGQPERDNADRDGGDAFEHLNRLAAQAPSGSGGLLFLPYLNSAGSPYWNPLASGAFLGVTQNHDRSHFTRAIMEGVAFEMNDSLLALRSNDLVPDNIRIGGGATRSTLWNQIQADVYGIPLQLLQESESTSLGAAMLGGIGAGIFDGYDDCVDAMVHITDTVDPDITRHRHYAELHDAFTDAYHSLAATTFPKLSAIQAQPQQPENS